MRGFLKPWQVAKLVMDIERLKDHKQLRIESIFDIPKEEQI